MAILVLFLQATATTSLELAVSPPARPVALHGSAAVPATRVEEPTDLSFGCYLFMFGLYQLSNDVMGNNLLMLGGWAGCYLPCKFTL